MEKRYCNLHAIIEYINSKVKEMNGNWQEGQDANMHYSLGYCQAMRDIHNAIDHDTLNISITGSDAFMNDCIIEMRKRNG